MRLRHGTARNLRQSSTDAEQRLWRHLRNRQLAGFKFRRQQPLGPYVVDFCCMERRLVIELDGGQHLLQQTEDDARSAYLEEEGYRVLRFWNDQVLMQTDAVLGVILDALAGSATPHPSPLPQGEREQ